MQFLEIWNTHKKHLLQFIQTKIDETYLAEDILQDVSIKFLDNWNRKTEIKNYKNWLFQVTRNTIADHYRKNEKRSNKLFENPWHEEGNSNSCVCDLSEYIIQTYLPEKYSLPLYLSDIEKVPQKDIAAKLDLSLAATKSRIQRGRQKLKELISECVAISFNNRREITDFEVKKDCELPPEIINEMEKLNLMP